MRAAPTGDVTLVPVPGHTPGQLAVIVEDDGHSILLATVRAAIQEHGAGALSPAER
jgi:hypothetical protein